MSIGANVIIQYGPNRRKTGVLILMVFLRPSHPQKRKVTVVITILRETFPFPLAPSRVRLK